MPDFVVHSVPGSPFGRAVLAALEEKSAAWVLAPVMPGTMKGPAHTARHPFGRVPVLEHGDFRLYETQAILRYIDRVLPNPPLTPAAPRAAARIDQVMNINDWYLFQGVGNVIGFQRIIKPRLLGQAPDEALIAAAMPKALLVYDVLAKQLGSKPYLVGESVTLADLLLAPQVDMFREIPEWEPLTAQHPNLRAWIDRMNTRPSMQATTWERLAAATARAA
jgi:glutathione S-transferase